MDGFLDATVEGVTELRVHGVSGTPPADILNHPHPWQVAGDGTTGFYRRWWPAGQPAGEHVDVPGVRHREAYAWGGLTSGGRTIALWLLLSPFSLANLAYFMLPRPEGARPEGARAEGARLEGARRLRHAVEAALRLFALLLTGTLVGAVTRCTVDLVGWQCTAPGRACTLDPAPAWLRWMGALWPSADSPRLAVASLVPLVVVLLLWAAARRTWERDEQTAMPRDGVARPDLLLARPRLWQGGAPVGRLRAAHVGFSVASIGVAVSMPFAGSAAGLALSLVNGVPAVAAMVLVLLPGTARRADPGAPERSGRLLDRACVLVRLLALLAYAGTFAAALAGIPPGQGASARHTAAPGAGSVPFALTVVLAVLILAGTWRLACLDRTGEPRAMGGVAGWFVLMAATGAANALALGVTFWTASFLGVPDSPESLAHGEAVGRRLFLDDSVWWTAALIPVLAVGLGCAAAVLLRIRRTYAATLRDGLEGPYGGQANGCAVADTWALASLTDRAGPALGLVTWIGLAGFAAVTVINLSRLLPPKGGVAGLLATVGAWALTTVVVGLVLLGRRTFADSRLRRTIGILWDICTFWPRAIHPLAPPCYTERVIPELVGRLDTLTHGERDRVVLSGHSQGSVLAAALVLQLRPEVAGRVGLLTHGSPLRRLYAAFFPAYFGRAGLAAVRATVTWINLYRLSDPIGGPVFGRTDPFAPPAPAGSVDRFCWDPARPGPHEPLPRTRWHSDYWLESSYDDALAALLPPDGHRASQPLPDGG
ncbi:hypothetical protein ACIBIZ_50890 [Nonomuraea spiralis]|uniref:hypothetical protein n=1 Tax=Nonomuraea spiralis TaxID=46182 RepID=UPI0037A39E95